MKIVFILIDFLFLSIGYVFGQSRVNYLPVTDDLSTIYGNVAKIEQYYFNGVISSGKLDLEKTLDEKPDSWAEFDYDFKGRLLRETYYSSTGSCEFNQWIYSEDSPLFYINHLYYGQGKFLVKALTDSYELYRITNGDAYLTFSSWGINQKSTIDSVWSYRFVYDKGRIILIETPSGTTTVTYNVDKVGFESKIVLPHGIIVHKYNGRGHIYESVTVSGKVIKYYYYKFDDKGNWLERSSHFEDSIGFEKRIITYYNK